MNSVPRLDLSVGGLGTAIYDTESQEWNFQRRPERGRILQQIGQSSRLLPSELHPAVSGAQNVTGRKLELRSTVDEIPELAPASSLLPHLTQVSEVVEKSASYFDPFVSDLIAHGKAKVSRKVGAVVGYVDVLALAAGPCGENVRLTRLRNDRYQWDGLEGRNLFVPALETNETGWWFGPVNCPVQQICVSESGRLLAVRNARGISFLRPILQKTLVPQIRPPDSINGDWQAKSPSRLDPSLRVTIDNPHTARTPYIDVEINPWNERQVAVLDAVGHWTVYQFEGMNWQRFSTLGKSLLSKAFETDSLRGGVVEQWGALLWAGDSRTLIICSRHAIWLHAVGLETRTFKLPNLNIGYGEDNILDMKRDPSNPERVFLLTSSRVFWLQILCGDERQNLANNGEAAEVLLSQRHHRSPIDLSSRLLLTSYPKDSSHETPSSALAHENINIVMLYSRRSPLITCFTFELGLHPTLARSIADPYALSLPDFWENWGNPGLSKTATITLSRISSRVTPSSVSEKTSSASQAHPPNLFHLLALGNDLSVTATVLMHASKIEDSIAEAPLRLKSRKKILTTAETVQEDDFVALDGPVLEAADETKIQILSGFETSPFIKQTANEDFTSVIRAGWLLEEINRRSTAEWQQEISLSDFQELLDSVLSGALIPGSGIQTLIELFSGRLPMDDVENTAAIVQQDLLNTLLDSTLHTGNEIAGGNPGGDLTSLSIINKGMLSALRGNSNERDNFTAIWHNLLEVWISSLNLNVHKDHRIMLLRHFTRAAFELFMSSYGIRRRLTTLPDSQSQSNIAGEGMLRDQRPRTALNSQGGSSDGRSLLIESQKLGARKGELPSSQYSSHTAGPLSQNAQTENPGSRRRYSPFEVLNGLAPVDETEALSEPLTTIVDHWVIGQNPTELDWDAQLPSATPEPTQSQTSRTMSRFSVLPIRSQSRSQPQQQPHSQSQSWPKAQSQEQLHTQPESQSQGQLKSSQPESMPERPRAAKPIKAKKSRVPGFN